MTFPTSNHSLNIATTGSGHVAMGFPAGDHNFLPPWPKGQIIFAQNVQPTKNLKSGKTTKTFIKRSPIFTEKGVLDEKDSGPPHAGTDGGVFVPTRPYIKYTYPTKWSGDCTTESGFVVRTTDTTEQNDRNCKGVIQEAVTFGDVPGFLDDKNKRCTITKVVGYCSHGRWLSAPNNKSNDGFSLDVISGDTVTLMASRTVIADSMPPCAKHTEWEATASYDKTKIEKKVTDTYECKELLEHPVEGKIAAAAKGAGVRAGLADTADAKPNPTQDAWLGALNQNRTAAEQPAGLYSNASTTQFESRSTSTTRRGQTTSSSNTTSTTTQRNYGTFGTTTTASTTTSSSTRGDTTVTVAEDNKNNTAAITIEQGQTAAAASKAKLEKMQASARAAVKGFADLVEFLSLSKDPVTVKVVGKSCAGAKNVTLRVFPQKEYLFDIGECIKPWMGMLEVFAKSISYMGERFGKQIDIGFCKPENLVFKVTAQCKELTQDKNKFFKSQVRPKYAVEVGMAPLLSFSITFSLPILTFVGPFGSLAAIALEELGIVGEIRLTLGASISVTATLAFDEYDQVTPSGSGNITATLSAGVFLEKKKSFGMSASANIQMYGEGKLVFADFYKPATKFMGVGVTGSFQGGVKGSAKASLFGFWDPEANFDWKPESLRFPSEPRPIYLETVF